MAKKLSEIYASRANASKSFVDKHPIVTAPNIYSPKAPAAKAFVDKLGLKKTTDKSPATKEDDRFKGTNVKTFDRAKNRFGYNPGEDAKQYGVGGYIPGEMDSNPPPKNGSTLYPSGTFTKEAVEINDDNVDMLIDLINEFLLSKESE